MQIRPMRREEIEKVTTFRTALLAEPGRVPDLRRSNLHPPRASFCDGASV